MNRQTYRLLAQTLSPLALGYLWWKGRHEPAYRGQLAERLGRVQPIADGQAPLWVHAASMGEVRAVIPLIHHLLAAGHRVHLTTNTPTGRASAERLGADVQVSYAPIDTPAAVSRFLNAIQPKAAIFVELELWPERLTALAKRSVPVAIVNARLSKRSLQRYQRLGGLVQQALSAVRLIAAQTDEDAARFNGLEVPTQKLAVTGNLKFDQPIDQRQVEAGRSLRARMGEQRPVWVAASVREGEAEIVLQAHQQLMAKQPEALLILVPRHPQGFRLPADAGQVARWSEFQVVNASTTVLLGDTTGELITFLAAADIAFVGGSLVPVGGHNPLEPAALGLPVLMGPSVTNFERVDGLLDAAGARHRIRDADELAKRLMALFADEPTRKAMGRRAHQVVQAHQGACDRTYELLAKQVIDAGEVFS